MKKLSILIIIGTTRPNRETIKAANLIYLIGSKNEEINVTLVDPLNFNFPFDGNDPDNKDPRYTKLIKAADGFFIVTPEYNHSFPGSLKRMLDSELANYIHKPVAFAGVSNGIFGGARAIEALTTTIREMGMVATFSDVYFPQIQNLFNEKGEVKDEGYIRRITRAYEELIWMAKALRYARETIPSIYHKKSK